MIVLNLSQLSTSLADIVFTMCELESQTLLLTSSGEHSSCTDLGYVGLDTVAFAIANTHNGLIVSLMTLLSFLVFVLLR